MTDPSAVALTLPSVQRIRTATGSRIEPPIDKYALEADQIAWHTAVVAHDTGLSIGATANTGTEGRPLPGRYAFSIGTPSRPGTFASINTTGMPFTEAWAYLNGISAGIRATTQGAAS